jgi:hypothetical protein
LAEGPLTVEREELLVEFFGFEGVAVLREFLRLAIFHPVVVEGGTPLTLDGCQSDVRPARHYIRLNAPKL